MDKTEIKQIDILYFGDKEVPVYYNKTNSKECVNIAWQIRNPESDYTGVLFMDNETGKISYPDDAIIPKQTQWDRTRLPQYIIVGVTKLTQKNKDIIIKRITSDYYNKYNNLTTMKRDEIFEAINSERDYQDTKWGTVDDPNYVSHEPAQFLIDIELHLNQAKQANYNIDKDEVMNQLRKIAALAVKCGEVHGMKKR